MVKGKRKNRFTKKVKAEVIEMLKDPDYGVNEIAKAYGISRSTLHKWKAQLREKVPESSSDFVEVAVMDPKKAIKKASMTFDDISVSIEGKINSKDLMSVISILESSC